MKNPAHDLPFPAAIADIGGTNARFQIVEEDRARTSEPLTLAVADWPTLEDALLEVRRLSGVDFASIIIAAAGPITEDGLDFTNSHWSITPQQVFDRTNVKYVLLFNDFEAQALALAALGEDDLHPVGGGERLHECTRVVLGPGTGLGVGSLVRGAGSWITVPGEGGHVDLGPRNHNEEEIWSHLHKIEGRVSAEEVLSGRGFLNLYQAVCAANGAEPASSDPDEIGAGALSGSDSLAVETLNLFLTCLGRVAGDLALTFMAQGGVYIAGGIAGRYLSAFERSGFRAAFEDKAPHGALLKSISTVVVTHPFAALEGLAAFAKSPDSFELGPTKRSWVA
ncbi:MAG: glucokinase [Pseudomonadota bacterium]